MCFSLTRYSTCLAVENKKRYNQSSRNPLSLSNSMTILVFLLCLVIQRRKTKGAILSNCTQGKILNRFWKLVVLADFLIPKKLNSAPPHGNFNLGLPPNQTLHIPFTGHTINWNNPQTSEHSTDTKNWLWSASFISPLTWICLSLST